MEPSKDRYISQFDLKEGDIIKAVVPIRTWMSDNKYHKWEMMRVTKVLPHIILCADFDGREYTYRKSEYITGEIKRAL